MDKTIAIKVADVPFCPVCQSPEVNPKTGLLNVRGFKVDLADGWGWQSECLRCLIWFSEDGTKWSPSDRKPDPENGIGDLVHMRRQ
jgi:hypothetical protein